MGCGCVKFLLERCGQSDRADIYLGGWCRHNVGHDVSLDGTLGLLSISWAQKTIKL